MPVYPPHGPHWTIQPPSTSRDKGVPTDSVWKDAKRVFAFMDDERHLVAQKLLEDVQNRIDAWDEQHAGNVTSNRKKGVLHRQNKKGLEATKKEHDEKVIMKTKELLASKKDLIEKLENRCRIFKKAQASMNSATDWTLASNHFGIKTFYRREDDGSLSLLLEGELNNVPLFEQIAVLREIDLHYKWAPFCSSSMTIAEIDKLDVVGWFMVGVPQLGLARDGCFRVLGCDHMSEDGTVILAGAGINDRGPNDPPPYDTYLTEDPILSTLDIPPIPTKRGCCRVTMRRFETIIRIISPTSFQTKIVANVDPHITFLSQGIIEFLMKHLVGVVLGKMQSATRKVIKSPVSNPHAQKMREEKDFYYNWLIPKFQAVCDERGWTMPIVSAFALSEEQRQHEDRRAERADPRIHTFHGHASKIDTNKGTAEDGNTALGMSSIQDNDSEDDLSDITTRSTRSLWSRNPLSSYLREVEDRTRQRKDAAVAEVRRRVADKLRPRQLPFEKQERLSELKLVKQRRLAARGGGGRVSHSFGDNSVTTQLSFVQRLTASMYTHGPITRSVVVCMLVVALFTVLHPDDVLHLSLIPPSHSSTEWWILLVHCIIGAFYICLCALFHYVLCDACLLYAFDSLELGNKTGNEVKRFYGDNTHLAVAVVSIGIVLVSFLKASLKLIIKAIIWSATRLDISRKVWMIRYQSSIGALLLVIPDSLIDTWTTLSWMTRSSWSSLSTLFRWAIVGPLKLVRLIVFRSTSIGRLIDGQLQVLLVLLGRTFEYYTSLEDQAVDGFPPSSWNIWCNDVFATSRTLFSYTAAFLLSTLILFHLSSRRSWLNGSYSVPLDDRDANNLGFSKSGSVSHKSIPEDDEVHHDVPLQTYRLSEDAAADTRSEGDISSFTSEAPSSSMTNPDQNRKEGGIRFRFGRRRKRMMKTNTSALDVATEATTGNSPRTRTVTM